MNIQQTKYTIERINAVEQRKIADLKKACTVPARRLDNAGIVELIRTKKVKIREDFSATRHSLSVSDVFDLSKYVNHEHVTDEFAACSAAITAAASKVRDEIMLGDNAEALILLREFEAS